MGMLHKFELSTLIFCSIFIAQNLFAIPQYTVKEGKKCIYCHYQPRGGGPTNARGRFYAKFHTFKGFKRKIKAAPAESAPAPQQTP